MSSPLIHSLIPYDDHGISFLYPDVWQIEATEEDGDIELHVSSEATTFWSLRILRSRVPAEDVLQSCIEAFQEEYEDLDVYEEEKLLAGSQAVACSMEFSAMELLNGVGMRCVRTSVGTLLAWWQGADDELEEWKTLLEHMSDSVSVTGASDKIIV